MAQRPHTVRASDRTWRGFQEAAKQEGVSASHWVMEAALARLVHTRVRSGHPVAEQMDAIYEIVSELRRNG